jgi:predicted nucleic acid-binding protein
MLLDTSGLLSYFDNGDARHEDAVTFFHAAPTRLTHSYVLAEFVALCQARRLKPRWLVVLCRGLGEQPSCPNAMGG